MKTVGDLADFVAERAYVADSGHCTVRTLGPESFDRLLEIEDAGYQDAENKYGREMLDWWGIDKRAFHVLQDRQGKLVGYIDIFGLRSRDFVDSLAKHLSTKLPDLPEDQVTRTFEWGRQTLDLYIDTIVVAPRYRVYVPAFLGLVAQRYRDWSNARFPKARVRRIATIALTAEGESLVNHLGFDQIATADEGNLMRHLYVLNCDGDSVANSILRAFRNVAVRGLPLVGKVLVEAVVQGAVKGAIGGMMGGSPSPPSTPTSP